MMTGAEIPQVDLADLNGSVRFSFAHGTYDIRFDYAAIARMQAMFGDAFLDKMQEAVGEKKISAICEVMAIATGKDKTAIMNDSPPILPAIAALNNAWAVAWRGGPLEVPDTDEDKEEETEAKKTKARATLLQQFASWLYARAYPSRPSIA